MSKYTYQIIIDKLPQRGVGNGVMKPDVVVVHHSAVASDGDYDIIQRLSNYANNHMSRIGNPGLAYHFYIPRLENDNNIYVTRYVNQIQWHASNGGFNARSIGILVDGNFQEQQPTAIQLKKLKQLLDDIQAGQVFPGNADMANLKPQDNTTVRTERGITLKGGIAGHSEVAEKGYGTVCPGKLLTYVQEYRLKQGKVSWGSETQPNTNDSTPAPIEPTLTVSACDSKINFVAGNLNSKIEQLTNEKNAIEDQRVAAEATSKNLSKTVDELVEKNHHLSDRVLEAQTNYNKALEQIEELKTLGGNDKIAINIFEQKTRELERKLEEKQREMQDLTFKLDVYIREEESEKQKKEDSIYNYLEAITKPKQLKAKFMLWWNKMPKSIRHISTVAVSAVLSMIIGTLTNLDLSDVSVVGISSATVLSLIISYLQKVNKELKDLNLD